MSNSIKDKLEIIIVTYNRKVSLEGTLSQLFAPESPVKDLDITVLDNKSTDGTFEVVRQFCKKHQNLKHVVNNRNIGGNGNIARAFETAKKEYVWVLCDDDRYNWKNWQKIEEAVLSDKYHAITVLTHKPESSIADIFYEATFAPAIIYRTSIITDTIVENMLCNIPNLFPHLALISKVINDKLKIYDSKGSMIIIRGMCHDKEGKATYIRGIDDKDLILTRRNIFWFVGYINSLKLIRDKKDRDFILDNSYHCCDNMFELLIHKLWTNMYFYNNNSKNLRDIYFGLNFKWRILFFICYLAAGLKYIFIRPKPPVSVESWQEYIRRNKTVEKIEKLTRKYENILLYGAGLTTEALRAQGVDFGKFKYISDARFSEKSEFMGVCAIPPSEIKAHENEIDVILVSVYRFKMIKRILKDMGIKTKIIRLF